MIKISSGESLDIDPLFKIPHLFKSCTIKEVSLGELPTITLSITSDVNKYNFDDKMILKLNSNSGYQIKTDIYLVGISYDQYNTYTLQFIAGDLKFLREVISDKYTGLNNAIKSIYPGDIIDPLPQNNINTELIQINESGYKFLARHILGLKKDISFSYRMDGLKITDLTNLKPIRSYEVQSDFKINSTFDFECPASYLYEAEVLEKYTNHILVRYGSDTIFINKEYESLIINYIHNRHRINKKGSFTANLPGLHPLAPGESVKLRSALGKLNDYYVLNRVIEITKSECTTNVALVSVNPY